MTSFVTTVNKMTGGAQSAMSVPAIKEESEKSSSQNHTQPQPRKKLKDDDDFGRSDEQIDL